MKNVDGKLFWESVHEMRKLDCKALWNYENERVVSLPRHPELSLTADQLISTMVATSLELTENCRVRRGEWDKVIQAGIANELWTTRKLSNSAEKKALLKVLQARRKQLF